MSVSSLTGGGLLTAAGQQQFQGAANLAAASDPVQQFKDFLNEPPEQQMEDMWLRQHGITKAQFDAMSPDEKQKIVAEMKRDIEQEIKRKIGAAGGGGAAAVAG